jgi:hypothetical protein
MHEELSRALHNAPSKARIGSVTFDVDTHRDSPSIGMMSMERCEDTDFVFGVLGIQEHIRRFTEACSSMADLRFRHSETNYMESLSNSLKSIEAACERCEAAIDGLNDFLVKHLKEVVVGDAVDTAVVATATDHPPPPPTLHHPLLAKVIAKKKKMADGVNDSPSQGKAKKSKKGAQT